MKRAFTPTILAFLLLLTALPLSPSFTRAQTPQPNCRNFPATGRQVCGDFLTYWDTHGGLAQQGYPISSLLQEKSATDGKTYTTQYFERAVFEKHPENQPPYNVLLQLLGVFEYKQRYPTAAPPNQSPNTTNPLKFPETGKTIGGRFRQYWEANGGLPQQGYPITDEFEEKSTTDGKTYTVQYFERAVFELHPENPPPNDVLLSLLGKFRYDRLYTSSGTPSPTPGSIALQPGAGRWITRAPIPTPRSEVAVAEVNGKIYVLGGFSSSSQSAHEEYDPSTNTWRARAALPRGLNHAGAVGLNGKLYLIGGYAESGAPVADAYEYDPSTDKWRTLAPMPTARGALGVAVISGKLYAIGGRKDTDVGANEVYDPATNQWGQLAPMPTPRDHLGVTALGGKIYAVGGRFEVMTRNTGVNEMFDPSTGKWATRAAMPTPRSGIAAVALQDHMLVFGGEQGGGTFKENEAYNPTTDTWVALAPMPTPRHGIGAAVVNNTIYIPSGGPTPGGSQTEVHEAFTLQP